MTLPDLSPLEARVLGVLVEKQHTVPDSYPLTLNALTLGCNQKSGRDPILAATETDIQQALDALKLKSLVMETSGGRVMRYAHNALRALALPAQSVALLATLMLRGPQTAGELRINADRLHRFADISAVEAFLHELAERPAGAMVAELPRAPGTREARWAQLLTGPPSAPRTGELPQSSDDRAAQDGTNAPASGAADVALLREEVRVLRAEVTALRAAVEALRGERSRASPDEPA